MKKSGDLTIFHGVGRRKKSVARVWLKKSKENELVVNEKPLQDYFDTEITRNTAAAPFNVLDLKQNFSVKVNICGGGKVGQSEAVRLGISRALISWDESLKTDLRKHHYLTVDDRIKERKKYGQRGARRKFQFVKR